jgi:hypothetical protein
MILPIQGVGLPHNCYLLSVFNSLQARQPKKQQKKILGFHFPSFNMPSHCVYVIRVQETFYGMGYFKKKQDSSLARGMRQASCLVLARQPFFDLFESFLLDGEIERKATCFLKKKSSILSVSFISNDFCDPFTTFLANQNKSKPKQIFDTMRCYVHLYMRCDICVQVL